MYFVIRPPPPMPVTPSWAPQPDSLASLYMTQSVFAVGLMDNFAGIIWLFRGEREREREREREKERERERS